jgi:hypothetical protein
LYAKGKRHDKSNNWAQESVSNAKQKSDKIYSFIQYWHKVVTINGVGRLIEDKVMALLPRRDLSLPSLLGRKLIPIA